MADSLINHVTHFFNCCSMKAPFPAVGRNQCANRPFSGERFISRQSHLETIVLSQQNSNNISNPFAMELRHNLSDAESRLLITARLTTRLDELTEQSHKWGIGQGSHSGYQDRRIRFTARVKALYSSYSLF